MLLSPIDSLPGVGPKTAETLAHGGIRTVRDLFYYLPRDYENYQNATKISSLEPGKVIIKGKIDHLKTTKTRRRNFTLTEGQIYDDTGRIRVVWYNQPYRASAFKDNQEYYFTGIFDYKYNRYQLMSPTVVAASDVDKSTATFQPIYSQKGKLTSNQIKKLMEKQRPEIAKVENLLPTTGAPSYVTSTTRADALLACHFPENDQDVKRGRTYLAYEELFELLLAAKLNKNASQKLKAQSLKFSAENTKSFLGKLPFTLTNAQKRATWDILQDLEKPVPMNRLLQGDVGAGKTVVAATAAHQAIMNHAQVALLAPTAILATQHYEGLKKLMPNQRLALLTGATKNKAELKKRLKAGEIDFLIGTHAIIYDDTEFKNLALCIIDEQHRFGVNQRQKLLAKDTTPGTAPHLLSMTATPIPRSLQLTIFGDLDVSVINQLPPGRTPIKTKILKETDQKSDLYPLIREKIKNGEQVYWICKAIEDNPGSETKSVKKQSEKLQKLFPDLQIKYLHGKMKPDEKDEIMEEFSKKQIQLLVSTTVVEVGVDVPNATLMVIDDAEQYGLAQLHQLRGRVGRGKKASQCYLIVTGENPPSRRLKEMKKSTDGFHLAEVDLSIRGPGEIYGSLQHGALDLRIASLADTRLISDASKQAELLAKDPENVLQYKELHDLVRKYQQLTTLN